MVNCASSLCHGSVTDVEGLQRPAERVRHLVARRQARRAPTRCCSTSARSGSRATSASSEPPHEAKVCLDCHAHNVPTAQRGERFKVSDGVTCEACHGPAERWLKAHVEPGATPRRERRKRACIRPIATRRAGAAVPVVPLRQRRQVRHPPHDGRRAIRA